MTEKPSKPEIGAFKADLPLILIPMQNGGWVVSQRGQHHGEMATELGAWTTAQEMLAVLGRCLTE